jgi:membrane protein YdbS with pleckstrin-like domain
MTNTSPDSPEFNPNPSEPSAQPAEISRQPSGGAQADSSTADRFRDTAKSKQDVDEEKEEDLWEGRYSSKAMYGTFILAAVVSVATVGVAIALGWMGAWLIWGCALVVIWGGLVLTLFYRQLSCKYLLTTQRFIHETGILKRTTDRIEVIDIDDVSYEQRVVERIFGVGSIKISSSDRSHPELVLIGIEDVKNVADTIDDVRRKERRRRGLHIEAI